MTHRRATVCLQHEFVIPLSARFHESWPFRKRTDVCQPMDRSTLHPKEVCGLCYGSGRNGERERERETARPKERLQSVPGNWEAKGGRNLFDSFVPRRARWVSFVVPSWPGFVRRGSGRKGHFLGDISFFLFFFLIFITSKYLWNINNLQWNGYIFYI